MIEQGSGSIAAVGGHLSLAGLRRLTSHLATSAGVVVLVRVIDGDCVAT